MVKAILLSVRPEHALNILNKTKTLELRKHIPKGFKGWVYVYVTKGGKRLAYENQPKHPYYILSNSDGVNSANGTIPFRFWFDEYEKISLQKRWCSENDYDEYLETYKLSNEDLCNMACVSNEQLEAYFTNAEGYAWHIKKLEVLEKPMQLSEFKNRDISKYQDSEGNPAFDDYFEITKAPQSFQYVWVKEVESA
jgi:predicted transcriptional regulator